MHFKKHIFFQKGRLVLICRHREYQQLEWKSSEFYSSRNAENAPQPKTVKPKWRDIPR
jgi:hypothetical protein